MHFGDKKTSMREWIYGPGRADPLGNERVYVERYERHNREVLEYFASRPKDLLVLDLSAGHGWPQLCPFLGHPTPEFPFPWRNSRMSRDDRAARQAERRKLRRSSKRRRSTATSPRKGR